MLLRFKALVDQNILENVQLIMYKRNIHIILSLNFHSQFTRKFIFYVSTFVTDNLGVVYHT